MMQRSDSINDFLDKLIPDKEENKCINCGQPFSDKNVFTPAGWQETKISNTCEKCFDEMFGNDE